MLNQCQILKIIKNKNHLQVLHQIFIRQVIGVIAAPGPGS